MFCLPPHTSHILQPLDVVLFQPYKHYHTKAIDYASHIGYGDFNKLEFLAAIGSIRQQTFKRNSILSSFQECGLVPYRPSIVLTKVYEYEAPQDPRRLSMPPPHLPGFTLEPITPMTDQALQRHADALKIATPSRKGVLKEQFKKGALIIAKCSAQLRATLAENTAAKRERKARKAQPKRQLQLGGTIYAYKARKMVRQRDEEGGTQLQRALAREGQLTMELEEMAELRENERKAYNQWRREFEQNNS
jgi:hypothetical protein